MKRTPIKRRKMLDRIPRKDFRKSEQPKLLRRTKQLKKRGAAAEKKAKRYQAYLSSPAWKAKRQEALSRDGYRCTMATGALRCPTTERLTVHHLTYARFGRERLDDIVTLCRPCHDRVERELRPWNNGRQR